MWYGKGWAAPLKPEPHATFFTSGSPVQGQCKVFQSLCPQNPRIKRRTENLILHHSRLPGTLLVLREKICSSFSYSTFFKLSYIKCILGSCALWSVEILIGECENGMHQVYHVLHVLLSPLMKPNFSDESFKNSMQGRQTNL